MKLSGILNQSVRKIKNVRYDLKRISRMLNDPKLSQTYFPAAERKTKRAMWWDNIVWLARNKEVNRYYYVYGLDRKNGHHGDEIISYEEFRVLRNSTNLHPNKDGYNYVCLLRDKFVFSQFLYSLGFPAPKNLAIVTHNEITWLGDMRTMPLTTLSDDTQLHINGFCKKLDGIHGKNAFRLRIDGGNIFVNDTETTLEQLKKQLNGRFLLQERITQHPKMNELHAGSINTIRLITFNNGGTIHVFSAALRIGTKGSSVDNWASGGIVIAIDLESGRLVGDGFFKPGYGGRVQTHPDTGVVLNEFQIPFFKESIETTCRLHTYLYGVHSIGWDIAITPEGPLFIEGNDDWEGGIPMVLERDFKNRFMKMFNKKA
jgi:hypothetical protein